METWEPAELQADVLFETVLILEPSVAALVFFLQLILAHHLYCTFL